ncbi:YdcF family protein [Dyella sp. ASV21]|jgi:vancomycin permeability regulator SanA|uniref:YdcF family protein n=1 Tax=Dyella sp. ASV21 TaxID=2795114 RepID=UPI0018EE0D2D|nr:YdcF family protein [Dyella sp. ASV21]
MANRVLVRCLRRGACTLALAWVIGACAIAHAGLRNTPATADLALVLGNTVSHDSRPMPRLEARLQAARALYARGGCTIIMVSGGIDPRDGRNEAMGMKRWLVEHGVPEHAVIEDALGNHTRASADHAQAWLQANGKRRVVVVSQYYHLPRAELALQQSGAVVAGGVYPHQWFARDVYSSLREVPGYLAYWLRWR